LTAHAANLIWNSVAGAAQVIFGLRFAWQWIVSERRRESVVPVSFWYFSLAGGLLLASYALVRDPVILVSAVPSVVIYTRNIALVSRSGTRTITYLAFGLVIILATLIAIGEYRWSEWLASYRSRFWQTREDLMWFAFGCAGNAVFLMRFIWQWIESERRGTSVIPVAFWHFSLVGGTMLTIYAIFRDAVVAPCQAAGLIVYMRNLVLIYRAKGAVELPPSAHDHGLRRAA
jgi:lipid-A-disaccharide synthase-like uncharacterized protein